MVIFLMADIYLSKKQKIQNTQDYTEKNFELEDFNNWWKNVLGQPLPCKKIAVKFALFFFNK